MKLSRPTERDDERRALPGVVIHDTRVVAESMQVLQPQRVDQVLHQQAFVEAATHSSGRRVPAFRSSARW